MTNPVILLGTQSNGETLPVQVDATGRLVAEGLQGIQGPPGPEGPEGPEGPPGPGGGVEWPDGANEGDVLTWIQGEPQWHKPTIPVERIWSDFLTSETGGWDPSGPAENAFDGNKNTECWIGGSGAAIFAPPPIEVYSLEFSIATNGRYGGYSYRVSLGEFAQTFDDGGDADTWFYANRLAGLTIQTANPLRFDFVRSDGSLANGHFARLRINGEELIDSDAAKNFYLRGLHKAANS